MNLPEAPVADQGFFVTHFFTVRDQEKSKDFYVRILGGKLIKPEDPCYIKLVNSWIILNSASFASLVLKLLLVPACPYIRTRLQLMRPTIEGIEAGAI